MPADRRREGRGEPADAITVADELTKRGDLQRIGGQAYLHELVQSVPTAANAGFYAQIVAERAVLRRLVDAGTKIVQMGRGAGEGNVEDIVNRAQAEVYKVADQRGSEDYVPLASTLEETFTEIEVAYGRQMLWPDHCLQGSRGADFHPDIAPVVNKALAVIRKGYNPAVDSYSGFVEADRRTSTGLTGYLRERGFLRTTAPEEVVR